MNRQNSKTMVFLALLYIRHSEQTITKKAFIAYTNFNINTVKPKGKYY